MSKELERGNVPAKIHAELGYGYGYGVGLFYQNHFLYFPAVLRCMGASLETAYKIYLSVIAAAIYFSAFYSAFLVSRDKYGGAVAAVSYLFSYQVISGCYEHFTMGSCVGMIFMPLAIAGMEEFLVKDKPPVLLGIGFWGEVCAHTLSAYMTFAVCLMMVIAYARILMKNPKKIGYLFLTAAAVLALTISFWLPMWEAFRVQDYKVSRPWTFPEENTVNIWSLMGRGGLGWLLFFWLLLTFVFLAEKKGCKEYRLIGTWYVMILGMMAVQMMSGFWILTRRITGMMQFPGRLFIPVTVLLIFCAALMIRESGAGEKGKKYLLAISFLAAVYFGAGMIGGLDLKKRTGDYSERILYEEIAGFGAGEEWLPVETQREMLNDRNQAKAEDGSAVTGSKKDGVFSFLADREKEYYDVPFIYYRGYKAVTGDGMELEVNKDPETSLVRVFMPKEGKQEGSMEVTVRYGGTWIQRFSYAVNAGAAIAAVIGAALWRRKQRRT